MKYKNISKEKLALIGIGVFKPDEVFETDKDINNPNFIRVDKQVVDIDKQEGKKEEKVKVKKIEK